MDVKYLEIERERLICERDRERERDSLNLCALARSKASEEAEMTSLERRETISRLQQGRV